MTGRGLRGRRVARAMLLAAVVPPLVAAFLVLAAPNTMYAVPSPITTYLTWGTGLAAYLIGIGWMVRLYPRDAAQSSSWRFERF